MTELLATHSDGLSRLAGRWDHLARWWISELRQAVPAPWLDIFGGKAIPQVFVSRDGDSVRCRLVAHDTRFEAQYPAAEFSASVLDSWLVETGFRRDQVALAAVLEQGSFLQRDLRVPNEALQHLPQILQQEVLRRTPFQPSEIWHQAQRLPDEAGDGVVRFCHWIIPRDRAAALVAPIGIAADMYDLLAARAPSGYVVSVIGLGAAPLTYPSWASRAIKSLVALLFGSIVLGLLLFEWAQGSVAADLGEELAGARQTVHGGGSSSAKLARMYALKSAPGLLVVWDELSRVLPDDTFLSEVRISAGRITISGYSSQAAHLVRIIDQSPIFSGATLVAAITPDPNEGKDRFRIAFHLRTSQSTRLPQSARRPEA